MSRLTDRMARQAEASSPADTPIDAEKATVGIQPRGIGVEEAEAAYQAARGAWLDALRGSGAGGNRVLAKLALAQEKYEKAGADLELARAEDALHRQRLEALRRSQEEIRRRAQAIAGQSAAWDRVHEERPAARGLGGLVRRLLGRR